MLIAVDVGNTNITVGTFAGEKLLSQFRLETDPRRSSDGYAQALKRAWRHSPDQCTAIIYASVVPGLDRILRAALRQAFGRGVKTVTPHSNLGFTLKVRAPMQVGADRILNALALNHMFGGPAIAIDFGTATTFDCIDSNGDYIGGSILLGPLSAARALHEYTAKLPLVSVRKPMRAIGTDTVSCVEAGLYFGYLGMIREVLQRTKSEMGGRPKVVSTGGLASLLLSDLPGLRAEPDLTLHGLRIAYEIMHH